MDIIESNELMVGLPRITLYNDKVSTMRQFNSVSMEYDLTPQVVFRVM